MTGSEVAGRDAAAVELLHDAVLKQWRDVVPVPRPRYMKMKNHAGSNKSSYGGAVPGRDIYYDLESLTSLLPSITGHTAANLWLGEIVHASSGSATQERQSPAEARVGLVRAAQRFRRFRASDQEDPLDDLAMRYGGEIKEWTARIRTFGTEDLDAAERDRVALDLDYVVQRLLRFLPLRQAKIWLSSHNASLDSRPIDALLLNRVDAVVGAVSAEEQKAFG